MPIANSTRNDGSIRPHTVSTRKLSLAVRVNQTDEMADAMTELESYRPRTRAQCSHGIRPCPFVSCRYHLYLDVNENNGSIKFNFPHLEVWEMPVSCALDVAEQGGMTLEDVGEHVNLTRERIRQFANHAKKRLFEVGLKAGLNRVLHEN